MLQKEVCSRLLLTLRSVTHRAEGGVEKLGVLIGERQSINKVHRGNQFQFKLPINKPQPPAAHQGDEEVSIAARFP